MNRVYRKPHQFRKKRSIFRLRFFWFGILIFVFLSALSWLLFFSEICQVKEIVITGQEKVSADTLKPFIENKLERKILFFGTKSIFLVDKDGIREDILNNFPQVSEVEISRGSFDSLNIVLIERKALAVWCSSEKCFLLDTQGIVFEEALEEKEMLKIRDEKITDYLSLGEKVIEPDKLSKIKNIESKLKLDFKIAIEEFIVEAEEKLVAVAEEGWQIYFNLEADIQWQLTKLQAVLEQKIPSEEREDLEYIELRFGNLAPFKYKD